MKKTSRWFKLRFFVILAAAAALYASVPSYFSSETGVVQAGCVITGAPSYVNGVPTCDCTSTQNSNCGCVVKCETKPPAEELEMQ